MCDTVYLDTQGIENSVYNGIVQSMPDLEPLVRAAYVFELQEVEKRLEALSHMHPLRSDAEQPGSTAAMEALWRRRNELLGRLWPHEGTADPSAPAPPDLDHGVRQRP